MAGRTIVGSGSKHTKGDVRAVGVVRIEAKTTQHDSFRVTKEMVEKLANAALGSDELPVIVIEFIDRQGKPIKGMEVAVVPSWVLDVITNK